MGGPFFLSLIKYIYKVDIDLALVEVVEMFILIAEVGREFDADVSPVPWLKDVV